MDYKDTVQLPVTRFAMRADLPASEPAVLAKWEAMDLYGRMRKEAAGRPAFVLHDGPPYANGNIHMGHAINKVLKDVIIKSRRMEGFDAPYVPGWDCHGLPIETKVEVELKQKGQDKESMDPVRFRGLCREYAHHWVDVQREEFVRLGVIGDWQHPYLTMEYRFEADILRELGKFLVNGGLFKGSKPVYWCVNDVTALAEAEVEYADHVSTSIHVKFPLAADESLTGLGFAGEVSVVIWTTTPWTIPANLAVCLHPTLNYVALRVVNPGSCPALTVGEILIVAEGLWESFAAAIGVPTDGLAIMARFPGSALEGKRFRHPYADRDAPILLGNHVTLEAGTGCVHTAPGHGHEDYDVGRRYGLEVYNPVDDRGVFEPGTPHFAGQHIFKANEAVKDLLQQEGKLLASARMTHSYPHCWRCHKPVILRATPQWFISMENNTLRARALAEIDNTRWIPAWGRDRIHNMVAVRPDWCVSRQRSWGVPIAVITCSNCGRMVSDAAVIETIACQVEQGSADVWYQKPAEAFLPEGFHCPGCGGDAFTKEKDILDVWFDSGVTHAAVLKREGPSGWGLPWPADLYLEGSDQHRGWFHSSLLASVGAHGRAPYRAVLTHGFVVDGKGRKMSKSLGNVIAPAKVIQQYGADILRMWVTAEDYSADIRISDEILKGLSDAYRRIRNTLRFLLGNLADFDPASASVPLDRMPELDRWALHQLQGLIRSVRQAYEEYAFHRVYQEIHYFCAVEMGAFYLDVLKDRLYCEGVDSRTRRASQTVLHHILEAVTRLMAPILSFTAEEVWSHMAGAREASVHLALFPEAPEGWRDEELASRWKKMRKVRAAVYRLLEVERREKRIGSFLEAVVTLYADDPLRAMLTSLEEIHRLFIVSRVEVLPLAAAPEGAPPDPEVEGLRIAVAVAGGGKCVRCWNRDAAVVPGDADGVCPRCRAVVDAMVEAAR
ncbi:MAG: isoleucine--tRNA ligase [Magnetococcales bacterium]|nr:isoleucine--tRNA ligase [Magnetococcales bacterium]